LEFDFAAVPFVGMAIVLHQLILGEIRSMRKYILSLVLLFTMLFGIAPPASALRHYSNHAAYVRHRRHVATAKRVGIGAAGGAAIGALAGGGKGAGIGALAGAGAGYLYDRHRKHHEHY
jgi:hypothetical protein